MSDNEALHRSNASRSADNTKSTPSSPPYSPVKIVGKSGCLEPHRHEQIQKPKTMSKKMRFTFNDDINSHARESVVERPSNSLRWETEKVGNYEDIVLCLRMF